MNNGLPALPLSSWRTARQPYPTIHRGYNSDQLSGVAASQQAHMAPPCQSRRDRHRLLLQQRLIRMSLRGMLLSLQWVPQARELIPPAKTNEFCGKTRLTQKQTLQTLRPVRLGRCFRGKWTTSSHHHPARPRRKPPGILLRLLNLILHEDGLILYLPLPQFRRLLGCKLSSRPKGK